MVVISIHMHQILHRYHLTKTVVRTIALIWILVLSKVSAGINRRRSCHTPEFMACQKLLLLLIIFCRVLGMYILGFIHHFGLDTCCRRRAIVAHSRRMIIVRVIADLSVRRRLFSSHILVERVELDIILTEQVFVFAETFQEFSFRKPALPLPAWGYRCGYTLGASCSAIGARKPAVTLYFPVLTA
jgi:hypothetical protein